jgi:uncharacterized YigZ family protein
LKVQGSRFIATVAPAVSREAGEAFVESVRKEFYDATHNCFAYRVGIEASVCRFNDDGEPANTAGKPILAAVDKFALTNVALVVTRYFGGTKLGVGGLIRAYGDAAEAVLGKATIVTLYITQRIRASFPHAETNHVMHTVSKMEAKVVDTTYDEDVHLIIEVRVSRLNALNIMLVSLTRGSVRLEPVE